MPGFDGTGPRGLGPRTGRGLGPCGQGLAFRRGLGRGLGRGLRFGCCPFISGTPTASDAKLSKDDEKKILKEELKEIEAEKHEIEKRLKELEN